jgi:hypothetical protein
MVAELPEDPDAPLRAWVALGSPCASVFVPVFPPVAVPAEMSRADSWARFAALRNRVEGDADALADVRAVLSPIEAGLWEDADAVAAERRRHTAFAASTWERVDAGLAKLGV